jgi:hypothetical protein
MKVVLLRKLADVMDGVDVRSYSPGDVVDLPVRDAHLLIIESWAIPDRRRSDKGCEVERRHRRSPAA